MGQNVIAFTFDENLQEVPVAPDQMASYIEVKTNELKSTKDANMQVKLMGEIGVFLRILRRLEEAEKYLSDPQYPQDCR